MIITDCHTLSSKFSVVKMTLAFSNNEETRKKIVDTSQKIQEVCEGYKRTKSVAVKRSTITTQVLLLLLTDNDDLRSRLDKEAAER